MCILIIGSLKDPQVVKTYNKLCDLGAETIVFDRFEQEHYIEIVSGSKKIKGIINGYPKKEVEFDKIKVVWWRFKSGNLSNTSSSQEILESIFRNKEWREIFNSLPFYLKKAIWVNDFWSQNMINPKAIQLYIAQEIGFKIPSTVLSNNEKKITKLFDNNKSPEVIYKTLFSPRISKEEIILTTKITKKQLVEQKNKISECPRIFQNFIEKEYELRITVIGNKVFTVRIDVSKNSRAYIDWKYSKMQDIYTIINLESRLESLIKSFHKKANLSIATYDIIKSSDVEYYFLEYNPAGQWIWIEEKLGLQITDELAKFLFTIYEAKNRNN
jgi:glutathione synthase/RimK-type ligase-like ATP-grasp enzyme